MRETADINQVEKNPIEIFDCLTDSELEMLSEKMVYRHYRKREVVCIEGKRINGIYIVYEGILKIVKTGINGKEQIIRFARQGDIIGLCPVIENKVSDTTSCAISETTICYIPCDLLRMLFNNNFEFAFRLLRIICQELGETNISLTNMSQRSVRERTAHILLLISDLFEINTEQQPKKILLNREDLANMVGATTESTIRMLSEFKSDNLIELKGKRMKILNAHKLENLRKGHV